MIRKIVRGAMAGALPVVRLKVPAVRVRPGPRTSAPENLARVVLVGVVSGLRSQWGTAAVALTTRPGETARPASLFAGAWAKGITAVAAAGELVADKLPSTPSRLSPPGFVPRLLLGALAAAALSRRPPGETPVALAAVVGALAAAGGAHGGARWRRAVHERGRPDRPAAVAEDLVALVLAGAACAPWRR
ncbi:hypothetical protein [Streptomyces sp. NPDC051569]|uniref:hypothetical protein n=1 Tax=Streptomyces sp. NPDC051569 TaxID=3365661 RepID=UPI0037ACAC3E